MKQNQDNMELYLMERTYNSPVYNWTQDSLQHPLVKPD